MSFFDIAKTRSDSIIVGCIIIIIRNMKIRKTFGVIFLMGITISNLIHRIHSSLDNIKQFCGTIAHYRTTFPGMGFCFHEILLLSNLPELYPSHISFDDDVSSTHIEEVKSE